MPPDSASLLDGSSAARRKVFLAKADAPHPDSFLKYLLDGRVDAANAVTRQVHTELTRAGGDIDDVTPLARQGTFRLVHKVRFADGRIGVARSARAGVFGMDPGPEADRRVNRWLAIAGLPHLTGVEWTGTPPSFQVSLLASGTCLADLPVARLHSATTLAQVSHALALLHKIEGVGAGPIDVESEPARIQPHGVHAIWEDYVLLRFEDHLEACRRMAALSRKEESRLRNHFEQLRPLLPRRPSRLLHGDPSNENMILQEDGSVLLIDWEDALVGDPLFDLASWATFLPAGYHSSCIRAYGIDPALRNETGVLYAAYFTRIALAKTVHRHRFGRTEDPGRLPAAHRIQQGLDALDRAAAGGSGTIVAS